MSVAYVRETCQDRIRLVTFVLINVWHNNYRIGANRSPGPVFFRGLCCGGLYSRGASIPDMALLIRRFSTAFKAPIMVCMSKNTSTHLQLYQEKSSVTTSYAKSSNYWQRASIKQNNMTPWSIYTQYIQYTRAV